VIGDKGHAHGHNLVPPKPARVTAEPDLSRRLVTAQPFGRSRKPKAEPDPRPRPRSLP